jgi:hypothetical protein
MKGEATNGTFSARSNDLEESYLMPNYAIYLEVISKVEITVENFSNTFPNI